VIVALGSNLGDPVANVRAAIDKLRNFSDRHVVASSLWKTSPVDCPPGSPDFVNSIAAFLPRDEETPFTLLAKFQAIEREFGRGQKQILNEPRPLDVDLIAFGRQQFQTESLILPHPRARARRFVLAPLAEIDPDYLFSGESATVATILAGLASGEVIERLGPV
jgi:2-amino-4-hydroxy-6-hydroxymethyldihydropteridine diphosphokinase